MMLPNVDEVKRPSLLTAENLEAGAGATLIDLQEEVDVACLLAVFACSQASPQAR